MPRKTSSEPPIDQLKSVLKKDEQWKKFRNIVNNAYLPEFDGLLDELSSLHKSRSTRLIASSGFPTGKKIANAASKEMAVRSRCVEICIEITRNRNWLAISMNTMQKRIETDFSTFLMSIGVRGVTDRKNLALAVMGTAQKKLDQLDTITEIADMIIADIDQCGFALRHIVASMEIATKRENG